MATEKMNSQDILNAIDLNKIDCLVKKKRGRPKKTELINTKIPVVKYIKDNDNYLEDDEIILHLPISKEDIMSLGIDNLSIDDVINSEKNVSEENDLIETENDVNKNYNNDNFKQVGSIIKKLKEENEQLKKYLTEITPMYFTEVKSYPIELKIFDIHNNQLVPKKTNINCWWCTYKFDCLPSFLPEKYCDNKFYVIGCFCSFNCSGAYNLNLNDNKVWERYSLLKQMYYMINKDNINSIIDIEINPAGPKELLQKYGGPIKIDEYRKNSKILGREYHKLLPPFIPISINFEETTNSKTHYKNFNINNLINSNNKNENIIIKRNKPLTNFASKHIDTYFE